MNIALNQSKFEISKAYYWLIGMAALAIGGAVIAFPLSYVSNSNVIIGFCLLPVALFVHPGKRFNAIYFIFILFFGITSFIYNVRIFYFFTISFYLIFLIELCIGKVNSIILFALLFMSPFFEQVAVILGFPIRLHLSALSGNMLSLAGMDIQVEGNIMLLSSKTFTVDEACMGLHMLAISLMMGLFIIAHQYRVKKVSLGVLHLTVFFASVFVFNLISNTLRIMMLVVFNLGPDHPMHGITGILCLVTYVVIPLYFLGKWMVGKFGKDYKTAAEAISPKIWEYALLCGLAAAILGAGISLNEQRKDSKIAHAQVSLKGFEAIKMKDGITKMYNGDLLVYVKPIPEFFSGEHTPLICWKGTGYEFKNVKKISIDNKEIYYGKLVSESNALFSAWWYSNGAVETIDQLEWRARMMKGEDRFCIVNVTANDEETLLHHLKSILKERELKIISQK